MKKSELISVGEASEILGISPATVKNWIKLQKLSGFKSGASFWLQKDDVLKKASSLKSSSDLRHRRNKSRQSKNFIPKSYIDNSSPNYQVIRNLLGDSKLADFSQYDILRYYASSLMSQAGLDFKIKSALLSELGSESDVISDFLESYPLVLISGEDTLGMLYLSLRGLQDKKSTGSYYTPFFVVDTLIKETLDDISEDILCEKSYLDPSCGTGNFLMRLPKEIPLDHVNGYDIDTIAISLCRINLAIKYVISDKSQLDTLCANVRTRNFLLDDEKELENFDICLGNPPWGYSFTLEETNRIKTGYESCKGTGKPESFSLFIERALSVSDQVSFLLPETLLEAGYHRRIRNYIFTYSKIIGISYLGEVFDKVQCPSIILRLGKSMECSLVKSSFYIKRVSTKEKLIVAKSFNASYDRITPDNFNLLADDEEYRILEKMMSAPHFTLRSNADFALGIVTGSNATLLHDTEIPGSEPIIKGKEISKYHLSPYSSYTVFSPERYQQVAPEKYYRAKDKLFYKFIATEPVVVLDNKGLLSLNSANIIVPHIDGYTSAYIMAILNSSAISFYYRHSCRNLKVLRSVLESLPIPCCDKDTMEEISELSLDIQRAMDNGLNNVENMIKKLDKMVLKLYNLNTDEIRIIIGKKV